MILSTRAKGRVSVVVLSALVVVVGALVVLFRSSGDSSSVAQPIAFSHKVHADKQIDCAFCHEYVSTQAVAGMPGVQLCMTCHSGLETRTPEIQKLFEFAEKRREVPWKRVYHFPHEAYVIFNHKRHVAANISCQVCHGDVARMTVAERVVDQTMGWCMDCHRQEAAKFAVPQLALDCRLCHK